MLKTKLLVIQKKISKLFRQKFYDNVDFKNRSALLPREHRQSLKKPNLFRRILAPESQTSVYRFLSICTPAKIVPYSKVYQTSKVFWKVLLPQVKREDRHTKSVWVTATTANYPKLTRGFKGKANNPLDYLQTFFEGQLLQGSSRAEGYGRRKPIQRKHRRKDENSEISEQEVYTSEFPRVEELRNSLGPFRPLRKKAGKAGKTARTGNAGKTMKGKGEVVELPAAPRCRLSCPLPPPEFFPPEKLEYLPYYQSPSFRFGALSWAFFPQQKPSEGKVSPYMMKPRGQMLNKTKFASPLTLADFRELMARKVKYKKNYLKPKSCKSQMYEPQLQPLPATHVAPKMKALLFEPNTLTLTCDSVRAPTRIFKDEVLVQVSYSGVCGTDLLLTEGKVPCGEAPIILGHEISGRVYAAGKDVQHVQPGDLVAIDPHTACTTCRYCSRGLYSACLDGGLNNSLGVSKNGGWAGFIVVKKSQVYKIPEELGLDQAALLLPLSCVLSAMSKLKLFHGMKIFIQGLGLSGCLWASLLHSRGFRDVFVSDRNEKSVQQFESLDLNYTFLPPEDIGRFAMDVVIECTGSSMSMERSLNLLNTNGQMCFFGKPNPLTEVRCIPYDIIQKEITIYGNAGNTFCFAEAIDVATSLRQRYLQLDKLGVQIFELEAFKEAFQLQKSGDISKIIFKFDS